jgi:hypothetical protein
LPVQFLDWQSTMLRLARIAMSTREQFSLLIEQKTTSVIKSARALGRVAPNPSKLAPSDCAGGAGIIEPIAVMVAPVSGN